MVKILLNLNIIRGKIQSPLTNIFVYNLETYNKDIAVPYCSCIWKLKTISGKCNRDTREKKSKRFK